MNGLIMRRVQRRKVRYGLPSALLAFLGAWALTTLVTPETGFNEPRWQGTLWVLLGAHFIELAVPTTFTYNTVDPMLVANAPSWIRFVPIAAVAITTIYTTSQIRSRRIKHNISNALGAGMGYFIVGVAAMVVSDMRPDISGILMIALFVGGGIWIGSTAVRSATGGLPFIGITSLGTLALVGILIIMGGVAVASVLRGLIAISFGVSGIVGVVVGVSRQLESRGSRRGQSFARAHGAADWLEENWMEVLIVVAILGSLAVGLSGGGVLQG
jgi:hypothetical protein